MVIVLLGPHPSAGLAVLAVLLAAAAIADGRRLHLGGRTLGRFDVAAPPATPVPPTIAARLNRAGLAPDRHTVIVRAWCGAVLVALVATALDRAAAIPASVIALGPPAALFAAQNRAERQRRRDLPSALEATVAALRAGHSLTQALAETGAADGPARADLAAVSRRATAGTPLVAAIEDWATTRDDHVTRLAAAALAVAAEAGGPGADGLEAAATSIRDRAAVDDEIHALSVQARASAGLLTLTPIVFTGLLTAVDPGAARFLLGTRIGLLCLVGGLALDGFGAWWMHRLVARAR